MGSTDETFKREEKSAYKEFNQTPSVTKNQKNEQISIETKKIRRLKKCYRGLGKETINLKNTSMIEDFKSF